MLVLRSCREPQKSAPRGSLRATMGRSSPTEASESFGCGLRPRCPEDLSWRLDAGRLPAVSTSLSARVMVRSRIRVVKRKPQDIAFGRTQYVSNCIRGRYGTQVARQPKVKCFNELDPAASPFHCHLVRPAPRPCPCPPPPEVISTPWQHPLKSSKGCGRSALARSMRSS